MEDGKEHPYCSRSHSAQGASQGIDAGELLAKLAVCLYSFYVSAEVATKPEDRCAIPGCWKAKFVDAGVTHPFCSKSHRKKAEAMGSKREYTLRYLMSTYTYIYIYCLQAVEYVTRLLLWLASECYR